ncbi:MAG: AMP-binding protein [Methyloprofundus sp.]|nr:AMP-binding protein [Methyloprofundus sp.]
MPHILSHFLQQCTQTPDNIAFVEEASSLTYAEFQTQIHKISTALKNKQIQTQCIAIALNRGTLAATCIYSVLYSGGIYLPLDMKTPAARLSFIINDAQPTFIIGLGSAPSWLVHAELWLDINTLLQSDTQIPPPFPVQTDSLAAILYTSGSTGKPKGIALSHQALANFSTWASQSFELNSQDRIASLAPFHFDLSIFDLFSSLAVGASVYFMPAKFSLSPSRLTTWLSEKQISTWYTVPSLLSFIALKGALDSTDLSHLKRLLFAGEVFPTDYLIKLAHLLPEVDLYNLYGPTETNVCCYWAVKREQLDPHKTIPIGQAAANAQLSIDNLTGELQVQSLNNFSGYWQQGKLQPVEQARYATGDKVSLNAQGEYCYHGRLDRMLKCSGYRVEPAEIEHCINQLTGIAHCAVVGIKDSTSGQRPAALVVLKTGASLGDTIKPLRQLLPAYMQPYKFLSVDTLPVLSNGKIDYQTIETLFKT